MLDNEAKIAEAHRPMSRALIALAPEPPREPPANFREAPFLTQLIASKHGHPQLRQRRRVTPAEAVAAYQAAARLAQ